VTDGLLDLLKRIAQLKRAPKTTRAKYPAARAPYKPILLLTVLRRLQQGRDPYRRNIMDFALCAQDFGTLYSRLFGHDQDPEPKIVQAYWYLGSGKPHIWDLHPQPGKEDDLHALVEGRAQLKTARKLTTHVHHASFPPADWALLNDPDVQDVLIAYLITEHFSQVQRELQQI
jgi:hypothetical protein